MNAKVVVAVSMILIGLTGPLYGQKPKKVADKGAASITASDVIARISFLASDALRGRDTPSQGLDAAAAYIASEYRRLGLEAHGDTGTYLQHYPYITRTIRGDSVRLDITARGRNLTYTYGTDIFALAGTPARASGDLTFAGAPTTPWTGAAFTNRVVVLHLPGQMDRAWRTAVTSARNAARTAGAVGLIVVLDPTVTEVDVKQRSLMFGSSSSVAPAMPVTALRYDRARELFAAAGQDLDALAAKAKAGTIEPVVLTGTTASVAVPVGELTRFPPNVVAVLPGTDPVLKNTYVVLSAHMDHIGVTAPDARGDSINNGADDDASGTTAVVEVAEAFVTSGVRPLRSIIFLNVSGEEKGLLGSQYFSEHPVVPLASIVADINIDMIGRNAADTVVAIGQDYSSLGPTTQGIAAQHPELHLTVSRDIWPQERFFFRSDHYNFARKDIPAIFFFSGVHEDYHRPSDQVEKINGDKAARIAKLAYYLARDIADGRAAPKWTEQGLKEVHALTR